MIYAIQLSFSNSDGGSGYEKDKFETIIGQTKRHEHFRDAYHVNRKIKERLSFDKKMSGIMIKTIKSYDWNKVLSVLDSVESRIDDPQKEAEYLEQIDKLKQYLNRNWKSIKPLKLRNLPILKGLGVCESNHRPFSYRMKRQGRGFTKKGAVRNALKKAPIQTSRGAVSGSIVNYGSTSSPMGRLNQMFS